MVPFDAVSVGKREGLPTAVPATSTWSMILIAGLPTALYVWRRRVDSDSEVGAYA